MRTTLLPATASSLLVGALLVAASARAQVHLDIKEPKVEAGEVGIQYLGDYALGPPRRRFMQTPGGLVFDDNGVIRQRHSLGLGYGLTNWLGLQVSIEAEQGRIDDPQTPSQADAFGDLKPSEVELEATVVLVPASKQGFAAAALLAYSIALEPAEADKLFLGTALQHTTGPWSATVNLFAVKHVGGREERAGTAIRGERWDFQYAAQVKYQVNGGLALALEGFGIIERVGNSGTRSDERELFGDFDRHVLGPAIYYTWGADTDQSTKRPGKTMRVRSADADDKNGDKSGPNYTVGAGVLFGLNDNTPDVVLKWTLDVNF